MPAGSADSNTQSWGAGPQQSAPAWVRPKVLPLWKSQRSHYLLNILHLEPPAILAGFWRENPGPGHLTSAMTCLVAGVSGVYRIFPTSRGLRAFHMMRERGLDSKLFIISLQYGPVTMKGRCSHACSQTCGNSQGFGASETIPGSNPCSTT